MEPVWDKLEELQMPINWHVADPSRYWRPENHFNRLEDDSYFGEKPWKFDLLMQQQRVLERHPDLVVVAAHSNYLADMVPLLQQRLEKFPNYYIDLSATCGEWGRVPEELKFIVSEYGDRVLFGTDAGYRRSRIDSYDGDLDRAAEDVAAFYLAHFLFYGTDQRRIPVPWNGNYGADLVGWENGFTRYTHDGVDLPDDRLRKIYYENAERLFRLDVSGWQPPEKPDWAR